MRDLIIGLIIGAFLGGGLILDNVGQDLKQGNITKDNKVYICKPLDLSEVKQ